MEIHHLIINELEYFHRDKVIPLIIDYLILYVEYYIYIRS